MSSFTIRQLEYFVASVEAGSLTGAAKLCQVSHAGIANGLNELERTVGTQLLVRRKAKGVVPTAAGRAMLPLARNMLRDAAGIDLLGQSGQEELTGELVIGCNLALSPVLIPLIASEFADQHPKVHVVFRERPGAEILQLIREGQVDAGLMLQRQMPNDLEYVSICPVRVKVALAISHPLATRTSISLAELAREPAITPDGPALKAMLSVLEEAGVEPDIRWTLSSPETIRAMVSRGLGYSLLNVFPPISDTGGPAVAAVPVNDQLSGNALVMALPPRRRRISTVEKLSEILHGAEVRALLT
ncbi:LysR family transcriptional regulator [Paenarthrobacter sp. NPDC056912]|uniref:LysR family transcriptional regulator n=1 Tax=Paenarthrobacter sp. NPDC056912 TaxID=3345965 RepID=UPI00366AE399